MSDLYDADILEWSERQAELLRRVAAGDRSNDNLPDWPNIIEEIESVGRSELSAVESLWTQAFLHDLKADAWPLAPAAGHWRGEARLFRRQAKRKFTESMRRKLDLSELYADALAGLPDVIDGQVHLTVPTICPVTLDELLREGDAS